MGFVVEWGLLGIGVGRQRWIGAGNLKRVALSMGFILGVDLHKECAVRRRGMNVVVCSAECMVNVKFLGVQYRE